MALAYASVATIDSPEFINLQPLDINPLMSSCQIKVFYLGQNDNGTAIYKEAALQMAKTLRGAPIVGYYKEEKEDFADHGRKITIDDQGIHFDCMTRPYGFVSPDADVWFQKFNQVDRHGNQVVREYMMTNGYLWTGQFPQAQDAIDNNRPQSMEIDKKSVKGEWTKQASKDLQFFIINSGIFSKLCILGDDVEPCFEGAGIGKDLTTTFSKDVDNNFKQTLYSMMQDLEFALKGGSQVADLNKTPDLAGEPTTSVDENQEVNTSFTAEENKEETVVEEATEFVKKEEDQKEPEEKEEGEDSSSEEKEEDSDEKKEDSSDDDDKKRKYSLDELEVKYEELENKYNELNTSYSSLETELNSLREFKANIEREEKQNKINEFSMLSDEDKKDVIDNIDTYTLDDIESKLAVICYRKKVNFNSDNSSKNEESMKEEKDVVTTFNLDVKDTTPDWVKAVKENM